MLRKDGSVTTSISLRNFVGEGIKKQRTMCFKYFENDKRPESYRLCFQNLTSLTYIIDHRFGGLRVANLLSKKKNKKKTTPHGMRRTPLYVNKHK